MAAVTEAPDPPPGADAGPPDSIERAQRDDLDLRIVRSWLEEGAEIPEFVELLQESEAIKIYWHQKDRLCLRDGVIYRRTPEGVDQIADTEDEERRVHEICPYRGNGRPSGRSPDAVAGDGAGRTG